ncbi:hypothetical protein CKSOR_00161 [Candidatus Kinetoplastibacterium sorsogonicusi]|uniref:Uncharacterized protein n=1 Tax=Candidatus Kinetoplastidibacterium kentomonadis TaxID=1576550 RepID=A0A3Q8ETZ6_9PROT|nr:TerC family protein [Candidatus Kinetoplastibacterium sorsogonicusi]AWD32293.1 hypothetical protein CKSOR_00161 [Candidatus Kinetoplastibacterium sorsogonicusi]
MGWALDPNIWIGFFTLIFLEVILGIDNLIFITILIDKLPFNQKDKALIVGIVFALIMRFILLFAISWLLNFNHPIFFISTFPFSIKNIILLIGGFILLIKSFLELYNRLTIKNNTIIKINNYTNFWFVVLEIVLLDAVFSLDAVITAISIVDNLIVMMIAITIAMIFMLIASKSLTIFLKLYPNIIILCLVFLIFIGLSLIFESIGITIPKEYFYLSILFSVLIEILTSFNKVNNMFENNSNKKIICDLIPLKDPINSLTLSSQKIDKFIINIDKLLFINVHNDNKIDKETILTKLDYNYFVLYDNIIDNIIGVGKIQTLIINGLYRDKNINVKDCCKPILIDLNVKSIDLLKIFSVRNCDIAFVMHDNKVIGFVTLKHMFDLLNKIDEISFHIKIL